MKLQKKCRRVFEGNGLLSGGLLFQLAISLCFILDSAQFNYLAQLADHLTMLKSKHHITYIVIRSMVGQIVFGGNSIYISDVIVELDIGLTLIVETKGHCNDNAYHKAKSAERWVDALNQTGSFGLWRYVVAKDPTELPKILNDFCVSQWDAFDLWDITDFNLLHLKQAFIRYWVFLVLADFVQEF